MRALQSQLAHLITKHGDVEVLNALAEVFKEARAANHQDANAAGGAGQVSLLLEVGSSICAHTCMEWPTTNE